MQGANCLKSRVLSIAFTGILLYSASPVYCQAAPSETVNLNLDLNEVATTSSFVKAYVIESESQFVPGNLGDAYLGDFALENDKFRAVIARPEKPSMGLVQDGSLMDITLGSQEVDYFGKL